MCPSPADLPHDVTPGLAAGQTDTSTAVPNNTVALLNFAAQFSNFEELADSSGWAGWRDPTEDPCAVGGRPGAKWANINCTEGVVTGLFFSWVNLDGKPASMPAHQRC